MNVIHLPPRLTVVPVDLRSEPQVSIAHACGRLRSALDNADEARRHMTDAAFSIGDDREQNFDNATVSLEEALLDLLTLTAHGGEDMALRQILRARRAEREHG